MKKRLIDVAKMIRPLSKEKQTALAMAEPYLDREDLATLRHYLKIDRCFHVMQSFGTSKELLDDAVWPVFKSHLKGAELHEFLERVNGALHDSVHREAYERFAPNAHDRISSLLATNIVGLEAAKRASILQLFASEPIHVLLIGDPGTGKTDILRGLHELSPISSFGLGSGVSGVGLSAMMKGEELMKGLLPLADGGIACIDELNLIKGKDLGALYNAMEKGFVSYDKGAHHETLPARVSVCATANPAEHTFIGQTAEVLRKQIPFDDALLSRFHLVFIVRKPSEKEFEEIATRIVKGSKRKVAKADAEFVHGYVQYAQETEVALPGSAELQIVNFVKQLKRDERKFIAEIGPRTVVGIVRLAKAIARSTLAVSVSQHHLDEAFNLVRDALYVRKDEA